MISSIHIQKLTALLVDLPTMSLLVCQVSMLLLVLTRKQSWSEENTWGRNFEAKGCTSSWAQVKLQTPPPLNFQKARFSLSFLFQAMNFMRSPEGGRGWESFGEDPYLTGVASAETITGIQSQGVIATAKHFIANDQEKNRHEVECHLP